MQVMGFQELVGLVFVCWMMTLFLRQLARRHEKKQKELESQKLLNADPEAWERKQRIEIARQESRRAGLTNAAASGFKIARWLLRR